MSKKLKKNLYRIIIGAAVYAGAIVLQKIGTHVNENLILIAFLAAYFVIGGKVVKTAVQNIGHGQIFDEKFLMTIATVGAFLIGDYLEAVAVMLFYQVGEWFQSYAVNKSRKSISELMNIRPDYANVIRNGKEESVCPEEVKIKETIIVKPGERIPLDGFILEGESSLDTMALTGESLPRDVEAGNEVISGCVNLSGLLRIEVSKEFGQSTVAKILDLVENATSKKAETENFISKFAKYYTPIVVSCAVLLAIIPSLITGDWSVWVYRALSFLVISCPCALVISIPLSFFGGLGGASKRGVLIKGSNYLEALADAEIVVMDKTGTLTKGAFKVMDVVVDKGQQITKEELLEMAAHIESYSSHPISQSILKAYGKDTKKERVSKVEEIAGYGVSAFFDGKIVYAGNGKLMSKQNIEYHQASPIGTIIHIACENQYLGYLLIADEIKEDAAKAVADMYQAGIKKIVMLTGDRKEVGEHVANSLGIKDVKTELLPVDKVEWVETLFQEKSSKGKLVFVGDGINDAPVLARADIGIAMGGLGSDAAIEAADVVIMTDEPSKISEAMRVSRKTLGIVKQNIVFAIGVKVLVLILAAFGIANMWTAVFADVGVSVIAIINAMRAMK